MFLRAHVSDSASFRSKGQRSRSLGDIQDGSIRKNKSQNKSSSLVCKKVSCKTVNDDAIFRSKVEVICQHRFIW